MESVLLLKVNQGKSPALRLVNRCEDVSSHQTPVCGLALGLPVLQNCVASELPRLLFCCSILDLLRQSVLHNSAENSWLLADIMEIVETVC